MKCPSCGGESDGRFCPYCGSEMPYTGPQNVNSGNKTVNSNNVTHVTNIYYVNQMPDIPASPAGNDPFRNASGSTGSGPAVSTSHRYISEPMVSNKNKSAALLLCFFLGMVGGHLFYVGRWKKGLLYLFTAGLFGFGELIDLFVIAANKFTDSNGLPITGNAVTGKRVIYLIMCLSGIGAMADSSRTDGSGSAGLVITAVFGFLLILSLIRKR